MLSIAPAHVPVGVLRGKGRGGPSAASIDNLRGGDRLRTGGYRIRSSVTPQSPVLVAARGDVIAMRRVAVVVALGALLGMLGGAVTASPALADGRGDGWQFVSMPPTFTVDPVFCGFEIQGTQLDNKVFVKALRTADGSMAFLSTGTSKISLTANGKTITANISGPVKDISFPDGSVTELLKGTSGGTLAPADAARFGLPGVFVSAGALTVTADATGFTSVSLDGHVLVDVCAALS
jgi:hypothetical protein